MPQDFRETEIQIQFATGLFLPSDLVFTNRRRVVPHYFLKNNFPIRKSRKIGGD